mgnify:CR=1 FL=1
MKMSALLLLALLLSADVHAADHPVIARLLARPEPPPGVVFEIVTADPRALEWAVPEVAAQARRLRARFPGLPIAVVTHGREMFALQKDKRDEASQVHAEVARLANEEDIPVHVCETHAGWRGVGAEAFPEYVNVSPAGPAQVRDYMAMGYVRVKITPRRPQPTPRDGLQ